MPGNTAQHFLEESRTLAVVGLSADPARDSFSVSSYLQRHGYSILGINPDRAEALGSPCFPSLSRVPEETRETIDLVVVFRRPDVVPDLLEECAQLGLSRVWLQLGVSSREALNRARELEIEIVSEQCIRVVHSVYRH